MRTVFVQALVRWRPQKRKSKTTPPKASMWIPKYWKTADCSSEARPIRFDHQVGDRFCEKSAYNLMKILVCRCISTSDCARGGGIPGDPFVTGHEQYASGTEQ